MPIRQTHIWIFGFMIACVLAMSGPLTYTFENTFRQTVDIDRKKAGHRCGSHGIRRPIGRAAERARCRPDA